VVVSCAKEKGRNRQGRGLCQGKDGRKEGRKEEKRREEKRREEKRREEKGREGREGEREKDTEREREDDKRREEQNRRKEQKVKGTTTNTREREGNKQQSGRRRHGAWNGSVIAVVWGLDGHKTRCRMSFFSPACHVFFFFSAGTT